jgi:murein L,D-transpeptidase YafK
MYKLLLAGSALLLSSAVWAATPFLADRVVVVKSEKKLYLVKNGIRYREFDIALGPRPRGPKQEQGDERTPEGSYFLDFKNSQSEYYKSIRISYPNWQDRQRAASRGVDPGGNIMIHGLPNKATEPAALIQRYNWTDGCIAVTNREMEIIWKAVVTGTPIDILP